METKNVIGENKMLSKIKTKLNCLIDLFLDKIRRKSDGDKIIAVYDRSSNICKHIVYSSDLIQIGKYGSYSYFRHDGKSLFIKFDLFGKMQYVAITKSEIIKELLQNNDASTVKRYFPEEFKKLAE